MEAMNIPPINAGGDPGGGRKLSSMSMAAKLKRNSLFLGDRQPVGRMRCQDTWPLACDGGVCSMARKCTGSVNSR